LASAAVAVADGANDGQKAMGLLAVALSGTASLGTTGGIAPFDRVSCAVILAVATAFGGRKIVARVSRGLSRDSAVDDLSAQCASAGVILLGAAVGFPLSTSTVGTSAMVGAGMSGRRRHVRWAGVLRIVAVWVLTVPACGLVAVGVFELLRMLP
jgi:PiT family inorganic phosphate transporter